MPFTSEELEKLRSELPRGAAIEIAERVGMKATSVRNVLSGSSKNDRVVIAAYGYLKELNNQVEATKAALANG